MTLASQLLASFSPQYNGHLLGEAAHQLLSQDGFLLRAHVEPCSLRGWRLLLWQICTFSGVLGICLSCQTFGHRGQALWFVFVAVDVVVLIVMCNELKVYKVKLNCQSGFIKT